MYILIGAVAVVLGGTTAHAQEPAAPPPPEGASPPVAPLPEAAPASVPPAVDPALQGRVDALEKKTRELERSLSRAEAEASAPRSTTTFQTDEGGFAVTSADRQYQVRFKGVLQVDGRRIFGDPTLGNSVDTFLVRRARPILVGTVMGLVDFNFTPDFGNNTVALFDAYADIHPFPWLRLRVGKFKPPVGLERLQSDTDLTFMERSLSQNLSAQRDIGLQLYGDIAGGIVRYEADVLNGNPDNGNNDIDSDHAKTFAGRLFLQPFKTPSLQSFGRLGLGIAAETGNEKGSATNTWLGSFKSVSQSTIFSYLATTPAATVFSLGRHTRINPQLYYYLGPFGLLAEWVKEHQSIANSVGTGALNNSAGTVIADFVLGGDASFEGVKPHKSLDLAAGGYGALEIAARYNWLNIDHDAFPTAADPTKSVNRARAFGVALNWQLSRTLKTGADFEETWFNGGAKPPANRNTEKVGMARFQVAF
ncbi:MAG TPA: porin [Polyangia bacterium]|nr:porin [Polyangia bacterium]